MSQLSPASRRLGRLLPALMCAGVFSLAACTAAGMPPLPTPPGGGLGASGPTGGLGVSVIPSDTLREPMVLSSVPTTVGSQTVGIVDVRMTVDTATLPVPRIQVFQRTAKISDTVLVPVPMRLRAYRVTHVNGRPSPDSAPRFPGPTFRVGTGDSVRIRLVNNLPNTGSETQCSNYPAAANGVDKFEDCFHGPNWTNIHYHGFHVTPNKSADDVLLQIAPGDSFQYAFRIPRNQSAGTHWYHPHKHGSVALQVTNGMSGAFFITGTHGLDSLTAANGWRERLLALQQVNDTINLMVPSGPPTPPTLVNGQYRPTIRMRPGEVQRWRLVDENITATAQFRVGFVDVDGQGEPTVYDVARDGVQYASANYSTRTAAGTYVLQPDTAVLLAPGNRLDVLVKAPNTTGRHVFRATPNHPHEEDGRGLRGGAAADTGSRKVLPPDTLFWVEVVGDKVDQQLPDTLPTLPPFLANLTGPVNPGRLMVDPTLPVVVFNDSAPSFNVRSASNPSRFFLGNARNPFMRFNSDSVYVPENAERAQLPMVLGSTQVWRVENRGTATNHPFHIHINPFQVLHVTVPTGPRDKNFALYEQLNTAARNGAPIWLDVVPLPLADTTGGVVTPGIVFIAQKYADFEACPGCGSAAGWFVMHCHILGHEERGMMQVLQIVNPGQRPTPAPDSLMTTSTGARSGHHNH